MSAILQDQDTTTTSKDWLHQLFSQYQEALNGERNQPIGKFRQAGFQQLQGLEFPNRRDEDWKYTGVARMLQPQYREGVAAPLTEGDLQPFLFPDLEVIRLVFINGNLDQRLSQMQDLPQEVSIQQVGDALKNEENRAWIETQVAKEGGTAQNTFLPLNQAFATNGLFLKVARNYHLERPIHLINISVAGKTPHFAHPQLFVWAQSNSESTVIESYHTTGSEGTYFNNTANRIELEANARFNHYKLQYEGADAFQINNTIVSQQRDSCYTAYAVDLGGRMVRNNLSADLQGSGIETHFYGIYLGKNEQHIDNQTYIDHAMPHCQSNELYKGVLTDKARGVFNGKVMVRQDAQKTNAFQQNSSLVLSPNAVMDAKPQLEIYADDVKCSHGATIGQLDETAVFYLRSRGIPENQTRTLLQQAFLGEVLNHMKIAAIRDNARARIEEKLS